MPSNFSGTISAVTPRSASCAHTLRPGAGIALCPRAHRTGQIGGAEGRVDAGREVALLFVQIEFHFDFLLSRGSPSSRSAMMLR